MLDRRMFIGGVAWGLLAAPLAAESQPQAGKLPRIGGNITGLTGLDAELKGKRIELLRELIPSLTRVGLLINAADPFAKRFVDETQVAAKRTGVEIHTVDVRRPQEIDGAFAAMSKQRAGAVIVQGVLTASAWQAGDLAVQHRLPSISVTRQFVAQAGSCRTRRA